MEERMNRKESGKKMSRNLQYWKKWSAKTEWKSIAGGIRTSAEDALYDYVNERLKMASNRADKRVRGAISFKCWKAIIMLRKVP